jgi:soluble lytic murein transglycosylase-like protein
MTIQTTIAAQTERMMVPKKKPTPFDKAIKNWKDSKVIQDIIKKNPIIEKIIMTESSGNPMAQNEKSGARGLMQIMKDTAELDTGFGVNYNLSYDELFDPEKNVKFGSDYYLGLKKYYGNDRDALVAYNYGPGNANKWLKKGGDEKLLPVETQNYIKKILD